ncbi:MAG TPA: ACP S-malonyltransferase [Candidatus Dormibacteraeota bacterium]|nr:ACP S-malonyltransferase [Candidatus Dormibacteraeota bacterium]
MTLQPTGTVRPDADRAPRSRPRVGLCFPGQGSQAAGMADGLLGTPLAVMLLAAAADAGLDLRAAIGGSGDALRATEVAQPALLLVEAVLAAAVPDGVEIVGVAGHSVGEYAALVAAGALDAAVAMGLVIERGRAMAEMREGAMAALLGASVEVAESLCRDIDGRGDGPLVVANLNAPGQVVLSGTPAGVVAASELARERGVRRTTRLNVSGAFHSPLMAGAAERVGALLDAAPFTNARVPVACNVDGAAVTAADELRRRLRAQLVSPVRWVDCVESLRGLGADVLVELGPGSVLSGLAKRIAPDARAVSVATLEGVEALRDRLDGDAGD